MPAELGNMIPAELGTMMPAEQAFSAAEPIESPKVPKELEAPAPVDLGVRIPLPVQEDSSASKGVVAVMDLPESDRTNPYPDRSYNWVNDHYDSSVNYDKMYGALVQKKSAEPEIPEWLTMGPFA